MFTIPAMRLADAQVAAEPGRVDVPLRLAHARPAAGCLGAHHFLEVPFAFDQIDNAQATGFIGDGPPHQLAAATHSAWVSFVKDGDPNNAALPEWPRYCAAHPATMLFGEPCRVEAAPAADEIALWDGVL